MKPVIAYVRVSTDQQADEGVSLDAQQARVTAWAMAHGHELAGVYVEAGMSGGRADNRPELQRALAHVAKVGGILVVYSLSRLARSTKDTIAISEKLERAGADLVSLSESIDTTSAAGRMIFRMLAVLSEFERDLVSERTTAALRHKRSQGHRAGAVPFGYTIAADGITLVSDKREQRIIEIITELRAAGMSYDGIAGELNDAGHSPKSGREWYASSVRSVVITTKRAA